MYFKIQFIAVITPDFSLLRGRVPLARRDKRLLRRPIRDVQSEQGTETSNQS